MAPDRTLANVCRAVADGRDIDWGSLDTPARDEDSRDLLRQLRVVSDLATAHRAIEDPDADRTHELIGGVAPSVDLQRWGRYELVEELGRGTFGRVYRAWDPDLERFIAIKLILPIVGVEDVVFDRVLREGRAIAKVSHPNVVSVLGVEVHDGQVGLCMELVNGKTLDEIVRTQGRLGAQEAAMIGQSVCRALSAVHGANLVHRDVKARNVMRQDGGRIVLMDFGAGQVLRGTARVRSAGLQGTPIYMSPEALAGAPGSVASDIYSTGVLLYFLVSGRYPFEGATTKDVERAHRLGQRHLIVDHRPDLPAAFVSAVEKALDPDPRRRQASASKLLMELIEVVEQIQPEPGPAPWRLAASFVARNVWRAALTIGAVILAALVLGSINSLAYRSTLGLDATLVSEGPIVWTVWGLRAIAAPAALLAMSSLVLLLLREIVVLVRRVSSAADQRLRRAGEAIERGVARAGFTPSTAVACLLIAFALVFDRWLLMWRFPDLITAILTAINLAAPEALARLGPSQVAEQIAYQRTLSIAVLVMIGGLTAAVRLASRRGERLPPVLAIAAAAAIAFNVLLLAAPYRILWDDPKSAEVYCVSAACSIARA
jgi:serine/threonine-protein kinase